MVDEPEAERLDEHTDEEGGPVKSFLEHLEDLRWVLIKSLVALAVGMLICLIAGDKVVWILKRPLEKAKLSYPGTNQVVTVFFGSNQLGLFLFGVVFCYFMLLPLALAASQKYSQWLGFSAFQWKADDYISFVCKFMLGMGLGFEMPVVILTLVKIGVLNYRILSKGRKYMIVINLVLGALLTTPEVITQLIIFLPLH